MILLIIYMVQPSPDDLTKNTGTNYQIGIHSIQTIPSWEIQLEDTVRQAVRLVAPVIRNTGRVEGSFIRELCSWGRSWVLNLWDLI